MTAKTLWRGGGIGPFPESTSVEYLFNIRTNLIRYEIALGHDDPRLYDMDAYMLWISYHCDHLEQFLLPLGSPKQRFNFSLMNAPGDLGSDGKQAMWTNALYKETYFKAWEYIANRFKNNPKVHVYDLCNECAGSSAQVHQLMVDTVKRIRKIDRTKRLSITPPHANINDFKTLTPIVDPYLWYTCHFYKPAAFTGQGIDGLPSPIQCVTTVADIKRWCAAVRNFQVKYSATIYVGEFSVSKFAEDIDRVKFLSRCIQVWEEYGWQWSYHSWFESDFWMPDEVVDTFLRSKYVKNII